MLGDLIESALKCVGITQEVAEKWLGPECGCQERKEKLNSLTQWSIQTLNKRLKQPLEILGKLMGE